MNDTISCDILTYVVEPLNRMLDGELSEVSLDYEVSISNVDWLRKHDKWRDVEEAQRVNLYTVRGMVDYCRECGYTEELTMALTPLYLELLTFPADRMCLDFDTQDKDERRIRRREASHHLRRIMEEEVHFELLFSRIEPLKLLERCVEIAERAEGGNSHWRLYLRALAYAAHNGVSMDWDVLYAKVQPELANRPANCIKAKMEYCCLTIAVVMIMRDERLDKAERERLLRQVAEADVWNQLFDFYSVLLNLPLHTHFANVIQIVNRFVDTKERMPYTHLLTACLRYNPKLLEAPADDASKREKREKTKKRLQEALKSDQSEGLDDLFRVLFPKAQMDAYSRDTTRLTTGEIHHSLRLQQERNEALVKQINEMRIEIGSLKAFREAAEQYGDSVSMDDLRGMLNRINDPEKAQLLFMNLDFHLRKNPAWKRHSDELADLIDAKFEAKEAKSQRLLEAASKPTTTHNHFEPNSCHFEAGSSMNGDVHIVDESKNQRNKPNKSDK